MGELEQVYGDRMDFNVVSAEVTAQSQDEIEALGFGDLRHGLAIYGPSGEPEVTLPGHQFGRAEIEAALRGVLSADT